MTGPNQHFIPQSILRGFGVKKRGNREHHVTVYKKDGKVFSPATTGIGASRFFYSEGFSAEKDLDQKITDYENLFMNKALSYLSSLPNGSIADARQCAEFVTHLSVRQAFLRQSFSDAAVNMVNDIASLFDTKDGARKMMWLDLDQPNEILREELDKAFEKNERILRLRGFTRETFCKFMFAEIQSGHDANYSGILTTLMQFEKMFKDVAAEKIADTHKKILNQTLAPEVRVQSLSRMTWKVVITAAEIILPDCITMAISEGAAYMPYIWAGDEATTIFVPLDSHRLLIGGEERLPNASELNNAFASCSYDYFIAKHKGTFDSLKPLIGSRVAEISAELRSDALKDYRGS